MGTMLWDYYVRTARGLTCRSLEGINTLDDWKRARESESGSSPSAPAMLDDEVADTIPISHVEGAHTVLDIPHAIGLVAPRPVAIPSFGAVRSLPRWAGACPCHPGVAIPSFGAVRSLWVDRAADARRRIANMEELNWRCLSQHSLPRS